MNLTTERHEHVLSVNVEGRIDGSNAAAFAEALRDAIETTDRAVIMNFRELDYIDHTGLDVVAVAAKSLQSRNARMLLCEVTDTILTLFRISGLDKILPIYRSAADARTSLDAE